MHGVVCSTGVTIFHDKTILDPPGIGGQYAHTPNNIQCRDGLCCGCCLFFSPAELSPPMGDGTPTRQEGSIRISYFLPLFLCGSGGFVLLCVVSFGVADCLCLGR